MITTDVLVVGAGPAGSAAAISLARAGVDVTIIDKAIFPRDKCCGDGLTTLALRLLQELGLDPDEVPSWHDVSDVWLRSPRGREIELPLPSGRGRYASVARRAELDAALVDKARSAGAEVHEGVALSSITPCTDHLTVVTRGHGEIRARYVVAADGMWSPTRKALGMEVPHYRGDWHAFRQYRRADGPRSRDLWVWFEPDLLPGYAWSFPLPDGTVNVGYGIVRGATLSGKQMASLWRELFDRPHIAEVLGTSSELAPHKAWPIPARLPSMSLVGPRTLFVGDAAAASDPMTGEGIGQALETGMLAAEALIANGALQPARVARCYARAAHRTLAADHRMAATLSAVLSSPIATEAAIGAVALTDWTRRNFARWMFEDYERALIATPRRWRSGMFDRDGAHF